MANQKSAQEKNAAIFVSIGSVVIAVLEHLDRPAPGEIVEVGPDWYVTFTIVLHAAMLAVLLISLLRLGRITADKPGQRLPLLGLILVGTAAAAYVLGLDLGLV